MKDETALYDKPPYCPLFSIAHGRSTKCMKEQCAWWKAVIGKHSACCLRRIAVSLARMEREP